MKQFTMKHRFIVSNFIRIFDENTAPDWLTSVKTVKGSTMDGRWFWTDHVLTLGINESIVSDFQTITRIS